MQQDVQQAPHCRDFDARDAGFLVFYLYFVWLGPVIVEAGQGHMPQAQLRVALNFGAHIVVASVERLGSPNFPCQKPCRITLQTMRA